MTSQTRTTDLAMGEQLVLWAFRTRLAAANGDNGQLVHGFRLAFGLARVEEALARFEVIFLGINQHLTRDMNFACKCIRQVTADEVALLSLFSACQHNSLGDARHIMTWLDSPECRSELIDRVADFSILMEDSGLTLPRRSGFFPPMPSPPASHEVSTVH
jgi:hypothetical protein